MRPIKFRAWDASEKELVGWGALIHDPDNWFNTMLLDVHEDKSDVLMQYTGLKDKNGVEIYEGDYLRRFDSDGDRDIWLYEVRWQATIASFLMYKHAIPVLGHAAQELWFADGSGLRYEVIGNIYENPDLLETKKGDRE